MVRKSERNKAQGTPEKLIPERTRKSTRQSSRRKKKSSSESEGEPDVVVDKDIKEQETSESKVTVDDGITWKIQSSNGSGGEIQKLKICRQRVTESNDSSSPTKEASPRRRKSTRSTRNLDTHSGSSESLEINNEVSHGKTFSECMAIPGLENNEDNEAINDKLPEPVQEDQPASDKEIPDSSLVADVPAVTESPSVETSECNDVEPVLQSITSSEEAVTESSEQNINVDNESMQCQPDSLAEQLQENEVTDVSSDKPSAELEQTNLVENQVDKTSQESTKPNEEMNTEEIRSEVNSEGTTVSDNKESTSLEEEASSTALEKEGNIASETEGNIASETEGNIALETEENIALETEGNIPMETEGNIPMETEGNIPMETEESTALEADGSTKLEDEGITTVVDEGNIIEDKHESNAINSEGSGPLTNEGNTTEEKEENTAMDNNESSLVEIELSTLDYEADSALEITVSRNEDGSVEENTESDKKENNMDESNVNESNIQECAEEIKVKVSVTESEERSGKEISVCNTSVESKDEPKPVDPVQVSLPEKTETNSDEILKKLNERTARFSKESDDNKKKDESINAEPRSPREEGELTPVLETKKTKHTTIVINRPKEVSSQPTKLKRNTDDLPPSERKRRLVLNPKPKEKEEDPFNISSQSLMLLVPEVKTITPEQVATFPLDDEDLTKFEMEQPSDTSNKKKINLKTKDVEVRVQNENRQVVKKKQIVIDAANEVDEMDALGPKLPLQENHRVVRKISLVTEDVKKVRRSPSPSGKPATEVLFITNLVRPFTIPQLRELLARTGTIAPNGFYIDKIKSKCYVKYTDVEMAVETRHALNGVRWPVNNPKMLKVEFAAPEDMALVQKLADDEVTVKPENTEPVTAAAAGWLSEQAALKPQRRVTTAVREWDMGKVGMGATEEKRQVEEWPVKQEPPEVKRRATSPVEAKYEPPARKIKKRDNDAPARLLDDLFRKTKATPCIYWLPLTAAQIAVKEEMRRQHMAEHERRLAELRKSDHSRRDKDREKSRDSRRKK